MINVEKEIGGKLLTLETGKIARQSAGSVVLTYGETVLLIAVNAAKEAREDVDFFPLQVEYREKHYASGKIPGGFFKREARPTEGEVLTSRLTDRPIRPLFSKSFRNETQVIITVLQSDGENISDTWAGVGASAALLISNIPWNGPIATVRVGMIGTDFIFNPTREQLDDCSFEMVVSGNKENIVMVEGEANEVKEEVIVDALKFAHKQILNIIRAFPELILAFVLLPITGLGPLTGTLAVGIHSIGTLGKLSSEVIEGIDDGPLESIKSSGGSKLNVLFFGVVPQVMPTITSYWLYRFEINLRASAVLGIVGAGGVGAELINQLRFRDFPRAGTVLVVTILMVLIVDTISAAIRRRIIKGREIIV